MKAYICEEYGAPEVLKLAEVEKPKPKQNEILIQVVATAVNSGDVRLRALRVDDGPLGSVAKIVMRIIIGFKGPRNKVLGAVLSGIVTEIGDEVDKFKVGDEVFAMTGMKFGGFAEYATLSQDKGVSLKPIESSFEEASAIAFGGTTALYFLHKAGIAKSKKVLIYGSTGAVGTSAVQIAKSEGADVTAVSGPNGIELSKSLGADRVYNYKEQDISDLNEQFDIIFDAVGKLPKDRCKDILNEGGSYVTVGGLDVAKEAQSDMKRLADMFDEGKLKAVIDKTFSFNEMVEAHRYVDTGCKKGNVVVTVSK
ncbi:MAG: NADPH:quinone reductase-like Zn-dependent oxidoreductase [Candidatus Paceibacteria bacterium]|jgi:NADPH:quinone reductase-like Zn-dependent oxidoreductase